MDLNAFVRVAEPTQVKIGEMARVSNEPKLLDCTSGRTVPILPISVERPKAEVEESLDALFGDNDGPSDSLETVAVTTPAVIPVVTSAPHVTITPAATNVAAEKSPRRKKKKNSNSADVGEASHPTKKLRADHPLASVEATPIIHADSVTGPNLCAIKPSERVVILFDSSHHSGSPSANAEVTSYFRCTTPQIPVMTNVTAVTATSGPSTTCVQKETVPRLSLFIGSSSSLNISSAGGFEDLSDSDFVMGHLRNVVDADTDAQNTFVPKWHVTNSSLLDDANVFREMVDEFAPPKFFASVRGMEHDQLFTEFNIGATRQMSLSADVRMRAEYNIRDRRRLLAECSKKQGLVGQRDAEISTLKEQLRLKEAEASEALNLHCQISTLEASERSLKESCVILEKERDSFSAKVTDIQSSYAKEIVDLSSQLSSVQDQNTKLAAIICFYRFFYVSPYVYFCSLRLYIVFLGEYS